MSRRIKKITKPLQRLEHQQSFQPFELSAHSKFSNMWTFYTRCPKKLCPVCVATVEELHIQLSRLLRNIIGLAGLN